MVYFLDYYHPFAGLCNQLYLITNHIHSALNNGTKLYVHKFNIDIFCKERILACEVFDIYKTNENLKRLLGTFILQLECPETIDFIPKLCIYPVSSIPILNCLEFNESILKKVKDIQSIFSNGYYSIHFRLDIDAIIHYTFGEKVYHQFMDLANQNEILAKQFFETLDSSKIEKYCLFLMKQYFTFITQFGFEKTWYISTSLTKYSIHDPMLPFLQQLVNFIINNGGVYYIPHKNFGQRELNALIDLLILRDSNKLIGFEGSSFSEGYCLKVNSIRKVTKEYLFVKEYDEV